MLAFKFIWTNTGTKAISLQERKKERRTEKEKEQHAFLQNVDLIKMGDKMTHFGLQY